MTCFPDVTENVCALCKVGRVLTTQPFQEDMYVITGRKAGHHLVKGLPQLNVIRIAACYCQNLSTLSIRFLHANRMA